MSVDLEAIAQRGRCEISSLRLALPLLEQGYTPPFLARYRRDELGGLDESSLWALSSAVQTEQQIADRREGLREAWEATSLKDPAIGHAINKANSLRMLSRLSRRLKYEASITPSDATRLAVRVLNPVKGDGSDFASIAAKVDGIQSVDAAFDDLDNALVERLAGDPRIISAAVRWLAKNARIHIAKISDPHLGGTDDSSDDKDSDDAKPSSASSKAVKTEAAAPESATTEKPEPVAEAEPSAEASEAATPVVATPEAETPVVETPATESPKVETPVAQTPAAEESVTQESATESPTGDASPEETPVSKDDVDSKPVGFEPDPTATDSKPEKAAGSGKKKKGAAAKVEKAAKKQKKISPRQRRRRWLVGVLKPLEGKRFTSDKLSSFQIVMLGRALRSQVAECSFEYDAGKLVAELQKSAAGFNHHLEDRMRDIVLQNEASIREAAEIAWWDDVQERASARLVSITADHLRRQVNRGPVDAKVVMSIDAVGPRTAATTVVSADGRLLHCEDLPCQLSASQRSQAVARMGELIHTHHVDLIVISNGPARRATMIALGDLIAASPEKTLRWTLADRGGADAYSGSPVSDQEMRSTPRRFRSAAWLAFSVLQPAQSMAKVDPLKLRLSSFQRELSDEALIESLEDVMVSGASRGGVDANSAPQSWLRRLPGVTAEVAGAIDKARRTSLFSSREAISEIANWPSAVESRQSLPFLRVFGSEETLDGTLIHPDDYVLAKKLAKSLELELPPASPPGYTPPDFSKASSSDDVNPIVVAASEPTPNKVEDFTASGEKSPEFAIAEDVAVEPAPEVTSESAAAESSELAAATTPSEAVTTEETETATVDADGPSEITASTDPDAAPAASTDNNDAVVPTAASDSATAPEATTAAEVAQVRQPRPERAKVDKCIKEWQIGARRTQQIVHWLCDPFGDSDASGSPPAVLSTMPSTKSLKPGDAVVGVVVGVMPFGVFVELAPDCSGLIHVSRVSDTYVEDLHEAVQIGDVVTAWVTGIDEKRRRVGLSAISPEREAELEEARRNRDTRAPRGNARSGTGAGSGGGNRGGNRPASGAKTAATGGDRGQGNQGRTGGPPSRDGRSRQGAQGGQGGGRGGRQSDRRSGGRSFEKKPESYRVVAKKDAKPLTDAMQEGKEPLRSFGDLLQFFDKDKKVVNEKPAESKPKADKPKKNKPAAAATPESETSKLETEPNIELAKPVDAPESKTTESSVQPASEAKSTEE